MRGGRRCGRSGVSMVRQNRAFTLVELVVVIGIIAILMSFLLPVLGRSRASAVSLQCTSTLRQIGQSAVIYAGESKGFFPQACPEKPSCGSVEDAAPPAATTCGRRRAAARSAEARPKAAA